MLTLNVGLSKKVGQPDYGSLGASCNVELEAESTLLDDPDKFRSRVRHLFGVVRAAVEEELTGGGKEPNDHDSNGHAVNGNGSNGRLTDGRSATQSQVRAIHAIASRNGRDLTSLLWDRFGRQKPESLSIKEASQLIDELKCQNGAGTRS